MKRKFILLFLCLCLVSCATPPTDPDKLAVYHQNNDPLEPYNRSMTTFNFAVNRYVYQPIAKTYRAVVPEFARTGISNFADNLSEPYTFVNAILQADGRAAAHSFGRFFTNTTLGVGGLFDAATYFGIDKKQKTFGQTLYKWGWKDSVPYLVLPFLGPSDLRETIGMTVGWFMDPIDYTLPRHERLQLRIVRYALHGITTIESSTDLLSEMEKNTVDPYVKLRTMYRQNKQKSLNEDDIEAQSKEYDIDFDFDDDE